MNSAVETPQSAGTTLPDVRLSGRLPEVVERRRVRGGHEKEAIEAGGSAAAGETPTVPGAGASSGSGTSGGDQAPIS
jgi:hypothetical protein